MRKCKERAMKGTTKRIKKVTSKVTINLARKMKRNNISIDAIHEVTGIPKEEIETL